MSRFRDRCSGRAYTPAPRSCRRRSSPPRTSKPSSRSARLPSCRPGAPYQAADLAAVSELLAAFDLTQSRYSVAPDSLAEIADSGNSGGAVIGPPLPDWRRHDLMRTAVELRVDGGAPVPGYRGAWRRDSLDVFTWLVNSLSRRGIALPAGALILTGSLTEPQPVVPGSSAVARFDCGAEVRMCITRPGASERPGRVSAE